MDKIIQNILLQWMILLFVPILAFGQDVDSLDYSIDKFDELDPLLISGRLEMLFYRNTTGVIRESTEETSRFYFNNIYLNVEGQLTEELDYIIEFQPVTSDLYMLGGFVHVAEALQGIASDPENEPSERQIQVVNLIAERFAELDSASSHPSFERVQADFRYNDMLRLRIGRVRNPFGFWDDYSLFRNLSALKTDPVSIGVSLRRTDLGAILHGSFMHNAINYDLGILNGENVFHNSNINGKHDFVVRLGGHLGRFDIGANYYVHDFDDSSIIPPFAAGLYFRLPLGYHFTLLGEGIYMENKEEMLITRGAYLQSNFNFSGLLVDGLRWNLFMEYYDSDLLKIDFDEDVDYTYKGSYMQLSNGLLYALMRDVDVGIQVVKGFDEEGDDFMSWAAKFDIRF